MINIQYPQIQPAIRGTKGKEEIFCSNRKKWVTLTPEEWVRQNFLNFMVVTCAYPAPLISVEKKLTVGERLRRYDIVLHNRNGSPYMVVECKESNSSLTEAVLNQVLRYNLTLQAPYFIITNGNLCAGFARTATGYEAMPTMPGYPAA